MSFKLAKGLIGTLTALTLMVIALRAHAFQATGHTDSINSVAYAPDGQTVLTGSDDHTASLWDMQSGNPLHILSGHTDAVNSVAYAPDGHTVLTASDDHTAILWDAQSGASLHILSGHTDGIREIAYAPDGQTILTGSNDHTAILWDADSGELLYRLEGHIGAISSLAYAPDSQTFVTGSTDDTARLWDVKTGQLLYILEGYHWAPTEVRRTTNGGTIVAYAPNGATIVTGSWDDTVRVWDSASGNLLHALKDASSIWATSLAYAPDSQMFIAGTQGDGSIFGWDIQTGEQRYYLSNADSSGDTGGINSLTFAPDGQTFLSAGHDGTAELWDAQSGKLLHTFKGHRDWVTQAVYSPDGKTILTGSYDHTAILWDVQSGAVLHILQ
jgi:WD40 repeat protein